MAVRVEPRDERQFRPPARRVSPRTDPRSAVLQRQVALIASPPAPPGTKNFELSSDTARWRDRGDRRAA